jgi:MFS family permease
LPVAAHEAKWQCDAAFIGLATAYFLAPFLAALVADRKRIVSGLVAFVALFVAHAWTPYLSLMFFGERWYQGIHTLFFAVLPAVAGLVLALLLRYRKVRHHPSNARDLTEARK